MSKPDVDTTEIEGAAKAIRRDYGAVIGENQARNIAYVALVGARIAKFDAERCQSREHEPIDDASGSYSGTGSSYYTGREPR